MMYLGYTIHGFAGFRTKIVQGHIGGDANIL